MIRTGRRRILIRTAVRRGEWPKTFLLLLLLLVVVVVVVGIVRHCDGVFDTMTRRRILIRTAVLGPCSHRRD